MPSATSLSSGGGLVQTGPFGSQLHRSDYTEGEGVPLVMPKNMVEGRIDYSSAARVNPEKAAEMVGTPANLSTSFCHVEATSAAAH